MIQLLEFYSLRLIQYQELVSISSSIPSSAFLSHSYAVCQNSLLCLNTYVFSQVQFFNFVLKCASYMHFALDTIIIIIIILYYLFYCSDSFCTVSVVIYWQVLYPLWWICWILSKSWWLWLWLCNRTKFVNPQPGKLLFSLHLLMH